MSSNTPIGKRSMVTYDPGIALEICEKVAEGRTITGLLREPGTPSLPTWYKWLMVYPELGKAYAAAREISAQSFEDTMLGIVEILTDSDQPLSDLMLKRYQTAMQQLRWSAERRDPRSFGEQKSTTVVVPVQINTSLDLNTLGGQSAPGHDNVYSLNASIPTDVPRHDDTLLDAGAETDIEVPPAGSPAPLNMRNPRVPKPKKPLGKINLSRQRAENVKKRMDKYHDGLARARRRDRAGEDGGS